MRAEHNMSVSLLSLYIMLCDMRDERFAPCVYLCTAPGVLGSIENPACCEIIIFSPLCHMCSDN
jgi:hypothetical protein